VTAVQAEVVTPARGDLLWVLNEYRAAEIQGAGAIMRMARLADSTELSANLTRHLRDEGVHAWLWTKAIRDLGGEIVEVALPYQARLSAHYGIPRSLNEFLALTWVSERRGVAEYTAHLDADDTTQPVKKILRSILRDEQWHVSYIYDELQARVRVDSAIQEVIDRALVSEEKAIADLRDLKSRMSRSSGS
jgi:Mn-containing catalase